MRVLMSWMAALIVVLPAFVCAEPSAVRNPSKMLIVAVGTGDVQAYRTLVAQGADASVVDRGGNPLVALAAYSRNRDILADLLRRGAPLNGIGTLGKTALGIASRNGDEAMITQLIDAGADLSAIAKEGEPPLVDAIRSGNAQAVRRLALAGANVNQAVGELKLTPTMIAIQAGNGAVLDVLLEMRADLEKQDLQGETALYWAIHEGNIQIVERLIGWDANMRNVRTGYSALAVAVGENRADIAELIRIKCPDCT